MTETHCCVQVKTCVGTSLIYPEWDFSFVHFRWKLRSAGSLASCVRIFGDNTLQFTDKTNPLHNGNSTNQLWLVAVVSRLFNFVLFMTCFELHVPSIHDHDMSHDTDKTNTFCFAFRFGFGFDFQLHRQSSSFTTVYLPFYTCTVVRVRSHTANAQCQWNFCSHGMRHDVN